MGRSANGDVLGVSISDVSRSNGVIQGVNIVLMPANNRIACNGDGSFPGSPNYAARVALVNNERRRDAFSCLFETAYNAARISFIAEAM